MDFRAPTAHQLFFSECSSSEARARLEQAFFTSLRLSNGTYKTTYHRRLDDLNDLVLSHLPPKRPLDIMDVAVSSGVSTVEWAIQLRENAVEHRMAAGDILVDAFLIEVTNGFRVLVEARGRLLQVDANGSGVCLPPGARYHLDPRRLWAFLRDLPLLAAGFAVAVAARPAIRSSRNRPGKPVGDRFRPLKLVSSALSSLPDVRIVEDDILADSACRETVDVLRAANIMNRGYFDEKTLNRMIRNLRQRLRPGGLLIVCRTKDGSNGTVNNASLFRLTANGRFERVARLNAGSEIEELVLSVPADR